ncbi:MAG: hypothetical protein ACXVZT_00630 [Terriglobales bacterium]
MSDRKEDAIESLIREIAEKHGILVGRDDPILILQTINQRLLQDSAHAQKRQLEKHKEELEALAQRWGMDAREKAERILTASLAAGKQAMCELMDQGTRTTTAAVATQLDTLSERLAEVIKDARRLAVFNVLAACITLAGASVTLYAILR